ncbi:MAG TPA: DUF2844 domain-containing protein [Terriglobales bacterium]|nr:DUF2844 domain-containing protein [Terriglobales bacterium]
MRLFSRSVSVAFMGGIVAASLSVFCASAHAVLGQQISSINSDNIRMKAQGNVFVRPSYSIHEMRIPNGTSVREFASPAGEVFAVSWKGPYVPDLRQLMGGYFDQYMAAMANTRRTHGSVVRIETGDLVFESGGHMRFIVGRAYLRSKLPDGVGPDAIQ